MLRLLLIFLVAAPIAAYAQTSEPFTIDAYDLANPLTIKVLSHKAPHDVSIERKFANEKEEKLLQIAEAVYPLEHKVKQNARADLKNGGKRQWWCSSFDGVLIPYAITNSAVAYYLDLSDGFRTGKPKIVHPLMRFTTFGYTAEIARHETYTAGASTFRNVYVVSLGMAWSQYCNALCGMFFVASRTVVLNEEGKVLLVQNDECASYVVS